MNPRLTVLCLTKELEWEDASVVVGFAVFMSDTECFFDRGFNFNFKIEWLKKQKRITILTIFFVDKLLTTYFDARQPILPR